MSCLDLGGEWGGELVPETLFLEEKRNFFEEYEPEDEFPADDVCSDACCESECDTTTTQPHTSSKVQVQLHYTSITHCIIYTHTH